MDTYGLIGWPVTHSLSPAMHNEAFAALGHRAVYGLLPVSPESLPHAISGLRALGIKGVSVTVPHKEAVIPLLDEVDETARRIGAVNTIVNREGRLLGYNTDWVGAIKALEEAISPAGHTVVVIGAGGAARAVVYALAQVGARVVIYNRTLERAQALAKEFGVSAKPLTALGEATGEILINTTSVGLKEDRSPAPREILPRFQVVMDIVYVPLETRLLREAQEAGCKVVNGLKMLVYQAVEQFYLWRGERPPAGLLEKAALKALTKGGSHGNERG